MSEISIVAARKVRLKQRADEGDERAKTALALAHDPNQFLATVQVGITMVGVLAGAYGGATLAAELAVPIGTVDSAGALCRRASPSAWSWPGSPTSR